MEGGPRRKRAAGEVEGCSQRRVKSGKEEEGREEGRQRGVDSKGNLTTPL